MKLQTEDLKTAFKICDFVPQNPVLESSLFLRLKQNGNNLTLSLTGSLWAEAAITGIAQGGKWVAFVDRKVFKTFINTASEPEIEIFYKDKLILKSGQRLELALHTPISGYESWAPKTTFSLTDDQKVMLKTSVKYLPNSAGKENVDCIYFGKDLLLVTDTILLMGVTGSVNKTDFFLLPDVARFLVNHDSEIAIDKNGIGASITNGFVFQPRSAKLDSYPASALQNWISEANKASVLVKVLASELLTVLRIASQFIPDKTEAVNIESKDKNLIITVDTNTGKFQRSIPIIGASKLDTTIKLPAKSIIPWLEYAVSLHDDCELEYTKLSSSQGKTVNASVFRFKDDVRVNTLIVADL
jgi:hypothetical protein